MRPFGSLIDMTLKFREPRVPGARLERATPPVWHRLDEDLLGLFNCACVLGELDAAADIIALAEKWHAKRFYGDEQQRRIGGTHLKRMRSELERRHIIKGTSRPVSR